MKTTSLLKARNILTILLLSLFIHSAAQQYSCNTNVINGRTQYKYSDNFTNYDIQVKGEIKVNDDDTEIVSISPGGNLKISKKTFGNKRSLIIESNSKGSLNYEFYEGRKEIPFDPEGKKWLADVLLDVVRITGIDVEGRTKRIYSQKGIDGFMEELHEISSNSITAKYFEVLLEDFKLNENETLIVISGISMELSSNTERGRLYRKYSDLFMVNNTVAVNYFNSISKLSSNTERGSVLRKISKDIDFNDPKVTDAYFNCIDKMSSNTERGSVLRNVENTQEISDAGYERLLVSVKKLSSNTETGSVIRSLDKLNMQDPAISIAYFNAIDGMTSNTEAGSTMRHLMKHYTLTDENYLRLLASVKKLSSNTEAGSILRAIKNLNLNNAELNNAYFLAINGLTSNTETGSVLRYTIKNYNLNSTSWSSLFISVSKLSSNTEMGSVMRAALPYMPFEKTELDSFFTASNHFSSNTERGSVLRTMVDSPKLNKYSCIGIIESSRKLSSDTEKSLVLRAVGSTDFVKDEEVKTAYIAAAKTLSSNTEYRRVVDKIIY